MIFGSCNFNRNYNGSFLEKKEVFKCLEYFENNGGEIIDAALNYGDAQKIIAEYGWSKKVITKIWKQEDLIKCFEELKTDHIYCVMVRDARNTDLLNYVKEYQKKGLIEKVGISIYYPYCELRQDVNALHVPCNYDVLSMIDTMLLHADVYIRSFYNLWIKTLNGNIRDIQNIKEHSRTDLLHMVDFVIGVDNLEQLKEDMELFHG